MLSLAQHSTHLHTNKVKRRTHIVMHTCARPPLWQWGMHADAEVLCRIILVGILICYIAAAAIELGKWSSNNLGTSYRVWPSWGWICAIVAGVLWWFVGSLAACESFRLSSLCNHNQPLLFQSNQEPATFSPTGCSPFPT